MDAFHKIVNVSAHLGLLQSFELLHDNSTNMLVHHILYSRQQLLATIRDQLELSYISQQKLPVVHQPFDTFLYYVVDNY